MSCVVPLHKGHCFETYHTMEYYTSMRRKNQDILPCIDKKKFKWNLSLFKNLSTCKGLGTGIYKSDGQLVCGVLTNFFQIFNKQYNQHKTFFLNWLQIIIFLLCTKYIQTIDIKIQISVVMSYKEKKVMSHKWHFLVITVFSILLKSKNMQSSISPDWGIN